MCAAITREVFLFPARTSLSSSKAVITYNVFENQLLALQCVIKGFLSKSSVRWLQSFQMFLPNVTVSGTFQTFLDMLHNLNRELLVIPKADLVLLSCMYWLSSKESTNTDFGFCYSKSIILGLTAIFLSRVWQ